MQYKVTNFILNIANNDERIRAVYLNGSRIKQNAPKDFFKDYEVVYIVTETLCFIDDKENFYGWLMQFTDGNRIDLHAETIIHAQENIGQINLL